MPIRETLNRNPVLTAVGTGVIILLALVYIWRQAFPRRPQVQTITKAYYTSDDGQTFQAFELEKVPPFQTPDGKEWVRAHVYKVDGQKKVMYLEKWSDRVRPRIEERMADKKGRREMMFEEEFTPGKMYKRPGDAQWLLVRDTGGEAMEKVVDDFLMSVRSIKQADGTYAQEVFPGKGE